MEEQIRQASVLALKDIGAEGVPFTVERPAESTHGDYAINAAFVAAKQLGKSPHEVAKDIAPILKISVHEDIKVSETGFINITLSRETIALAVAEASAQGDEWGKGTVNANQRVMVEYTDPNPFKEMHIGHLMSNTIGESVSRLIANEGATVTRACYSGDVGPHVAKAIWALRKSCTTDPQTAGDLSGAYVEGNRAYETSPEAKAEIDALNQALYVGDDLTLMEFWSKGRALAIEAFERVFKILGTHFDYYFFESETAESGMRIVRDGIEKGIFEESEGAVIYKGEKEGLHTLVFITSRGTPTYEAKEIGLAFLKEERVQTDRSIVLTGMEQIGHFKIVLAALKKIAPLIAAKTTHVPHGLLSLSTGKMSSREGNVITATELIHEVILRSSEKNPDPLIAEQVAIGAIKYMILRQAPGSGIIFDEEKSLSLEGDSGPYLQYALVRARKILTYAATGGEGSDEPGAPYAIERLILHFPEVVARAARELAPNILTTYLTELAAAWNNFYATEQVLGSPEEAYKQRVTRAFANTMTNGLKLLGIPTPERM
ncbi:arginine--tRNA ligase [Candidatus Kaiserbacteria bacterium RIFCSPLOWO2_12_FULL_52_8]|uniref:Arginine--tRNA ligase n=1 Tax=Candidatus Kaiserbacteria bacterium RIFCSPHIGHO2_01_FULL_53_31 TaxID=1798481 RepID=A0A1F6CJ80_9BACT|nr:MAG: arginine--tRNA ligase [Candidatus Kaiserbacteria bacterium RIFCSPHIGHO2_01_FULL_53_31]OGG94530.1 MAG: arginine--tRNA ligase [Candidatus Kaiserbacteria bacterium RIFCSPLOWO2_12_FULL_52_8]